MRSVGNGLTDGVIWRQLVGCPFPPSSPLPSTALLARPLIQAHCTPKPNFNAQPGSSASSSVPIQAPPPMPEWSLLGRHSCPRIRSLVVPDNQSPLAFRATPFARPHAQCQPPAVIFEPSKQTSSCLPPFLPSRLYRQPAQLQSLTQLPHSSSPQALWPL
jgi:hypothetical protein